MVKCKKCGSEMRKHYNDEQINEVVKNIKGTFNLISSVQSELKMRRTYECTNQPCSIIREISRKEIIKEFMDKKKSD